MNLIKRCRTPVLLLCLGMAAGAMGVAKADEGTPAAPAVAAAPAEPVVALVNGRPVTVQEYNAYYNAIMRKRYYHGKPPEAQAAAVRKEVADLLIERALLIEEAERRGIQPDAAKIEQAVAAADARYAAAPWWQQRREQLLPGLKEQAVRQSLFEQVEKAIRTVPPPTPAEVRAYYEQKPELFTEPEKLRLSVILLKVDPGASNADWDKARQEAQGIYLRIKDGADFAELARLHSADPSAGDGGDLGYLHGGMLPEKLQDKIDAFQVGDVAEPVATLEGISIFRVEDRVKAKLREFADVEPRARELLQRDQAEQAWKETTGRLRAAAKVEILVPLGDEAGKQEAGKQEADKQEADKQEADKQEADKQEADKQEAAKQEAAKQAAAKQKGGKKKAGKKKAQ